MAMQQRTSIFVHPQTPIEFDRNPNNGYVVLSVGEFESRVTIFIHSGEVERFRAALMPGVAARPSCPYCGTTDHLSGSPASDRCRERALAAPSNKPEAAPEHTHLGEPCRAADDCPDSPAQNAASAAE